MEESRSLKNPYNLRSIAFFSRIASAFSILKIVGTSRIREIENAIKQRLVRILKDNKTPGLNSLVSRFIQTISPIFHSKKTIFIILLAFASTTLVLAFFRYAKKDETYFLLETLLMSKLIYQNIWIGDYAVGLHGFIFKLIPSLLLPFVNNSLYFLSVYHILLAVLSIYGFYLVVTKVFQDKTSVFLALCFLIVNPMFIAVSLRYLREIPAILALIFFLLAVKNKANVYILGLIFLLLMDAKEHIGITFGAAYFISICLYFYSRFKSRSIMKGVRYVLHNLIVFVPSVIFLALMLFTHLVPINMYIPSLLGTTTAGTSYQLKHLEAEIIENGVSEYYDPGDANQNGNSIDNNTTTTPIMEAKHSVGWLISWINNPYITKIFSQQVFSYLSFPLIFLIPALVISITSIRHSIRAKDFFMLFLAISFLVNLIVNVFKVSNIRYFFPAIPLGAIFLTLFSTNYFRFKLRTNLAVTFVAFIFSIASDLLSPNSVSIKLFFSVIITSMWVILFVVSEFGTFSLRKTFHVLFSSVIIVLLTSIPIAGLILDPDGQINDSLRFGINREVQSIATLVDTKEKVLFNNFGVSYLVQYYRKDTFLEPEWGWELEAYIPKKGYLKTLGQPTTFILNWENEEVLRKYSFENGVEYLVITESLLSDVKFANQDRIAYLLDLYWLKLIRVVNLQNKNVFVFQVVK